MGFHRPFSFAEPLNPSTSTPAQLRLCVRPNGLYVCEYAEYVFESGLRMRRLRWNEWSLVVLPALLMSCSKLQPVQPADLNDPTYNQARDTSVRGDSSGTLFSFGGKNTGSDQGFTGLGVNAYLWRGALDTLSFMPLSSADPFGGVIITDWYQPPATSGERFKATAYILGRQLRADGVRVALFRQVQQGGQWVDAPISAGTSAEVENKVLARARELRAQSGS